MSIDRQHFFQDYPFCGPLSLHYSLGSTESVLFNFLVRGITGPSIGVVDIFIFLLMVLEFIKHIKYSCFQALYWLIGSYFILGLSSYEDLNV